MNEKAPCYNQKFGHNFVVAGGDCLQCGINQNELSRSFFRRKETIAPKTKEDMRTIHSQIQLLAKDISEYCGEPKKFGMYAGTIKRIGLNRAYTIFSTMKQTRTNIRKKGAYFLILANKKDGN